MRLPMNVINFASQTGSQNLYECFTDYFCHYMNDFQSRKIGTYDNTVSFAEKEAKIQKALLAEVCTLSGAEVTEDNARRMASNPMVNWATFAVVSNLIDTVLPLTIVDSIGLYTDIRNIGYGDSASFEVKPRDLFTVSQAGNAKRQTLIQKQFATTKTLTAVNHQITVQVSLYKVLCGQESLADFVNKAIISIEREMSLDAYGAFKTAITAASMPAALKLVGYDQQELLALCERVTAYNGGAKVNYRLAC